MKYRNITISGLPGSGSTTLLDLLKEELKFKGWKGFSGGEFMRSYAAEKGLFDASKKLHHDATHYEDDFDRKIDYGMREKLSKEQNWILEAWLSGFLAQGVDGVLKVLVICSNDAVRIDRVVNRDIVTIEQAKKHTLERKQKNLEKWARMYHNEWHEWVVGRGVLPETAEIDFWHPNLYDVVIDTFSHDKETTAQIVLDALDGKGISDA